MEERRYIIETTNTHYDEDGVKTGLAGELQAYTEDTAKATEAAEALARYDDFADLIIKPESYSKTEGIIYGIPTSKESKFEYKQYNVDGSERILAHQKKAAREFLRNLRGFGVLADPVGMGKTFEAAIVLSELAARGQVGSLLLVVRDELMISHWKTVLGTYFGMGEDAFEIAEKPYDFECECKKAGDLVSPTKPIIVRMEDFATKWTDAEQNVKRLLFDVVIVDEAHNLYLKENDAGSADDYTKGMKALSLLMINKRKHNKTFCLLLTATPHSGNLEKMFELWYFVRSKGGEPRFFESSFREINSYEIDPHALEVYNKEKKYYKDIVCLGTPTVAEFIKTAKERTVEGFEGQPPMDEYREFLLEEYKLNPQSVEYTSKSKYERRKHIDAFLSCNPAIDIKVREEIAKKYHSGVLRSIMIRQKSQNNKKRFAVNYYFYPAESTIPNEIDMTYNAGKGNEYSFTLSLPDYYDKKVKWSLPGRSEKESEFSDFCQRVAGSDLSPANQQAEVLFTMLNGMGFAQNKCFLHKNYPLYYKSQFINCIGDVTNRIKFVENYDKDDQLKASKSLFMSKIKVFVDILTEHKKDKALVFFDYTIDEDEDAGESRQWEEVIDYINDECPDLAKRLVLTKKGDWEREFKEKDGAILIVCDASHTEGKNLQESRIVVNFQVTPDPLAMDQRIGRSFRLGQKNDVIVYSLAAMNRLEGYALAYFNRINLICDSNGDATIIAGSNSEGMIAARCPRCKRVVLMSKAEYDEEIRKYLESPDASRLFCTETENCRSTRERGVLMAEIADAEFKCDKCGQKLKRSGELDGYTCLGGGNFQRGKLEQDLDRGSRAFKCKKQCVLTHCKRFTEGGELYGKCEILKAKNLNSLTSLEMIKLCCSCKESYLNEGKCQKKCSIASDIDECMKCGFAFCWPTKPHVLTFNEDWVADCPMYKDDKATKCNGKLRKMEPRTFVGYLKASFNHSGDQGASFCDNLLAESVKTAYIRDILLLTDVSKKI